MQRQAQHGRLGEWLLRLGFLEEHQITMALAKQYGLPLINLTISQTRSDVTRWIPGRVAKCSSLLPVGYDDSQKSLQVAVTGPVNFNSQEAVRRMVRKGILPFIADQSAVESLIEEWYEPAERDLSSAPSYCTLGDLLEIGRELLASAIDQRATNIRIELLEDFFWVRIDSREGSRHVFCRHRTDPLPDRLPLPASQFAATAEAS
jgi:hypothetical protein